MNTYMHQKDAASASYGNMGLLCMTTVCIRIHSSGTPPICADPAMYVCVRYSFLQKVPLAHVTFLLRVLFLKIVKDHLYYMNGHVSTSHLFSSVISVAFWMSAHVGVQSLMQRDLVELHHPWGSLRRNCPSRSMISSEADLECLHCTVH